MLPAFDGKPFGISNHRQTTTAPICAKKKPKYVILLVVFPNARGRRRNSIDNLLFRSVLVAVAIAVVTPARPHPEPFPAAAFVAVPSALVRVPVPVPVAVEMVREAVTVAAVLALATHIAVAAEVTVDPEEADDGDGEEADREQYEEHGASPASPPGHRLRHGRRRRLTRHVHPPRLVGRVHRRSRRRRRRHGDGEGVTTYEERRRTSRSWRLASRGTDGSGR